MRLLRVVVMGPEMRKVFIGQLLVGLIEKSSDVKVNKYHIIFTSWNRLNVFLYYFIFSLILSFPSLGYEGSCQDD